MPTADVSILNDALGPIMRGPSSSHTAAAVRIGLLLRGLCGGVTPTAADVDYDPAGSLATTAGPQGSNIGLCAGLLGYTSRDERVGEAVRLFREGGSRFETHEADLGGAAAHPNTYRIRLESEGGARHWAVALSTGGGAITLSSIDGLRIESRGDRFTWLFYTAPGESEGLMRSLQTRAASSGWIGVERLPGEARFTPDGPPEDIHVICVSSDKASPAPTHPEGSLGHSVSPPAFLTCVMAVPRPAAVALPFTTVAEMRAFMVGGGGGVPCVGNTATSSTSSNTTPATLAELALEYEGARSGLSHSDIRERIGELVDIYEGSVTEGLKGTTYEDRILGPQSLGYAAKLKELRQGGGGAEGQPRLLDLGLGNTIVAYASAFMEVKSSFGLIIGAPTAGSCGVLPGCLIGAMHAMQRGRGEVVDALLAAGLVGVFIATRSTFAAEEGGCQAECGAAGAMAAAGLATLQGGSPQQCLAAASMVLQSVLGMACDPIGNRVEAPCLLRNILAATMAASSANMAVSGYSAVIPFDEVVAAHWEVAKAMPRSIRCTGLGGLAAQPSAREIESKLGCGNCSCSTMPSASEIW